MIKNNFLVLSCLLLLTSSFEARIASNFDDDNQVSTNFENEIATRSFENDSTLSTSLRVVASDVFIDNFSSYNEERLPGPSSSASASPLCHSDVTSSDKKVTAAGCVMESLIPKDKTYRVSTNYRRIRITRAPNPVCRIIKMKSHNLYHHIFTLLEVWANVQRSKMNL